ncbi:DUF6498-containing protein [Salinigranum sp. GCM10025319]|uniref:DUF6498-containing protein n=1 Tax=Salinigranum sp. GCM10025319 TaxID=3252687 RepID=UPI0036099029
MPALRHERFPPPSIGFLPVLGANLLPLIGVLWLGWDPETLVTVYGCELLLLFPLAGVKALFAGRPPRTDRESGVISVSSSGLVDKRGSVTIHSLLPPLYPRNVPFAAAVVGVAVWVGLFVGLALSEAVAVGDTIRRPAVLGSVVALAVGQLGEDGYSYFRGGGYADVSPYAVVETPARQGFFLAFVLIVIPATGAAGTTLVLAGFVFVKMLFEWSGFHAERSGGGRLTRWLAGPDSEATLDTLETPSRPPSATIDTDQRAVAMTAVWRTLTTTGPFYASLAAFVWAGTAVVLSDGAPSVALWMGAGLAALLVFGVMLGSDIVEDVLANGWMTYRRVGDQLVAFDRLTDTPQWVASVDTLTDVAVVETRLPDRYLGTRTVTVTTGWGADEAERALGPVTDPDVLIEAFDLPIQSTELSPLNRWVAGGAIVSVALLVIIGGVVLFSPLGSPGDGLFVLFLLPLLVLVPKGLWRLAH